MRGGWGPGAGCGLGWVEQQRAEGGGGGGGGQRVEQQEEGRRIGQ